MEIQAMRKLLGQSRKLHAVSQSAAKSPLDDTSRKHLPALTVESISQDDMSVEDLIGSTDQPTLRESRYKDPVSQGLVTLEKARSIFAIFQKHLLPHFPVLVITEDSAFNEHKAKKPLLLHAILASGSSMAEPELYSSLSTTLIHEYSRRIMLLGEKSLELVQAMMVSSSWYYSADHWRNQRFYEYLNMASTVALDLGLNEPYRPTDSMLSSDVGFYLGGTKTVTLEAQDSENFIDRKRALIACYNACEAITMSLRRPSMMNFTMYMVECVKGLEASPLKNDNCLAAWARLMNMADEISVAYGMTDQSKRVSLADEHTLQSMTSFTRRVQAWYTKHVNKGYSESLFIMYHLITACIYEPALYDYYPPDTFKAPYDLTLTVVLQSDLTSIPSQPAEAVCYLVQSVQNMIHLFTSQDMDFVRSLPNHLLVRINYACVILVRIAMLDMLSPSRSTTYQDLTNVDLYTGKAIDHMVKASDTLQYRNPSLFVARIIKLRKWYKYQQQRWQSGTPLDESYFTLFAGPDTHPCLESSPESEPVDDPSTEQAVWPNTLDPTLQDRQQYTEYTMSEGQTLFGPVVLDSDWDNQVWSSDLIEADFLDMANQYSGLDDPNNDYDMSAFVPMQGAFGPPYMGDGLGQFGFEKLH
ncbi:hypothetical protein MBLNU457_4729t1 [Dothideomycetes sp. NU457]